MAFSVGFDVSVWQESGIRHRFQPRNTKAMNPHTPTQTQMKISTPSAQAGATRTVAYTQTLKKSAVGAGLRTNNSGLQNPHC